MPLDWVVISLIFIPGWYLYRTIGLRCWICYGELKDWEIILLSFINGLFCLALSELVMLFRLPDVVGTVYANQVAITISFLIAFTIVSTKWMSEYISKHQNPKNLSERVIDILVPTAFMLILFFGGLSLVFVPQTLIIPTDHGAAIGINKECSSLANYSIVITNTLDTPLVVYGIGRSKSAYDLYKGPMSIEAEQTLTVPKMLPINETADNIFISSSRGIFLFQGMSCPR